MDELTLNQFQTKLNTYNNDIAVRRMTISKGQNKVNVIVKIAQYLPIISASKTSLDLINMFPVKTEIGKYKDFTFEENPYVSIKQAVKELNVMGTASSLDENVMTPEEIEAYTAARKALIKGYDQPVAGRFVPFLTFTSPLYKIDYTIIVDKLHKDLFLVPGLHFLVDETIQYDDDNIQIMAYHIGGAYHNSDLTSSSQTCSQFNYDQVRQLSFNQIDTVLANLLNADPDIQAFGISLSKDLTPSVGQSTNFPVVYDKISLGKGMQDIQVARQDSVPSICVILGKASKFGNKPTDSLHNWVMFNMNSNRFAIHPNGTKVKENTLLSFNFNLF